MKKTEIVIAPTIIQSTISAISRDLDPWIADKLALYQEILTLLIGATVTDEASAEEARTWLQELAREKANLDAVQASGPGALGKLVRILNAKLKPLFVALVKADGALRGPLGQYVLDQRAEQAQRFADAQALHEEGSHEAACEELAAANEVETQAPAGTSVRSVWCVVSVDAAALPPEWLVPNMAEIEKFARKTPSSEEPWLEGVTFELRPMVRVRK